MGLNGKVSSKQLNLGTLWTQDATSIIWASVTLENISYLLLSFSSGRYITLPPFPHYLPSPLGSSGMGASICLDPLTVQVNVAAPLPLLLWGEGELSCPNPGPNPLEVFHRVADGQIHTKGSSLRYFLLPVASTTAIPESLACLARSLNPETLSITAQAAFTSF